MHASSHTQECGSYSHSEGNTPNADAAHGALYLHHALEVVRHDHVHQDEDYLLVVQDIDLLLHDRLIHVVQDVHLHLHNRHLQEVQDLQMPVRTQMLVRIQKI